jgi:alanine dehydrogenase
MCPLGSLRLTGSPLTYEYEFAVKGSDPTEGFAVRGPPAGGVGGEPGGVAGIVGAASESVLAGVGVVAAAAVEVVSDGNSTGQILGAGTTRATTSKAEFTSRLSAVEKGTSIEAAETVYDRAEGLVCPLAVRGEGAATPER